MPSVRISSMYDLQTNSKMGIIGVHTPSVGQLVNKYPGLLRNYKYIKVKSCSVKIACASVLPADPLQVGVTAGKISPADLMNPILYRAVSNESWNVIINRLYSNDVWGGDAASGLDDAFANVTAANSEKMYYSLLSGRDWRKVMPQQGMSVKGLRPLVHSILSVFGNQFDITSQYSQAVANDIVASSSRAGTPATIENANTIFRGKAIPMPAIPTASLNVGDTTTLDLTPQIPKTMVLAVVIPPMQIQQMYYRMIVSWDVAFFGLRPATEIDAAAMQADGAFARYARWTVSSSKELQSDDENQADTVGCIDTLNMSPELVMES